MSGAAGEGPVGDATAGGASGSAARAAAERLLASSAAALDAIERGVARVADGTYGRCEQCGGAIEPERLEADPAASSCGRHAVPGRD